MMLKVVRWNDLPGCCKSCKYLAGDSKDEYSPTYYLCLNNLILPTSSEQCKKYKVLGEKLCVS